MFKLQLLGVADLRDRKDRPLAPVLSQPKRLALLAYLALHEGFCRRDSLLAIFWPDSDHERARGALRKAIYLLRRDLGEGAIIGRGDEEIGLSDTVIWCDAREVRRAVERGDMQAAVDLYRGELLPAFFLADVPDFHCWLDRERERLCRATARAADALIDKCESSGDLPGAVHWARRRLELVPGDEAALRRLLSLLEQFGDRAGAISAYEHFSRELRLTFDLEPSRDTQALIDRIRAGAGPIAAGRTAAEPVAPAEPTARPDPEPVVAVGSLSAIGSSPEGSPVPAATEQPDAAPSTESPRRLKGPRATYPGSTSGPRRWKVPGLFTPSWRPRALAVSLLLPILLIGWTPTLTFVRNLVAGEPETAEASVAVLPIVGVGRDADYLSVGLTDELINALARLEGVRVASRTSVFALEDSNADVREVAKKLEVRHILEGSLRRDGDRIRLSVQLIDTRDGRPRWAESYERRITDVLTMQEEVSRSVIDALQGPLTINRMPRALQGTRNPAAYDDYLRGRFLLRQGSVFQQGTAESVEAAIRYFSAALSKDSTYALPYVGLAQAYLVKSRFVRPMSVIPRAKDAAETALRLNESLPDSHLALAQILLYFDWDWSGAEAHYKRALELSPDDPSAHYAYADFLKASRRFDASLQEVRRGLALERAEAVDAPAFELKARGLLAYALYASHRYPEALAEAERALELDPASDNARFVIVLASQMIGDYTRAGREIDRLVRDAGVKAREGERGVRPATIASVYARAGRREEAQRMLTTLLDRSRTEFVPKEQIAGVYLALGNVDEAMRWYEGAMDERYWFTVSRNSDPLLEELRDDPRFRRLLERMNAPS